MADIDEWGITAADNNVTSPDGAQTGWVGADVGPWGRETMAAIARWYGDPTWVNPMKNGLDPTGNKTITRSGGDQIQIVAGSNWGATTTDRFVVGRVIRVQQTTGTWHYAFIRGVTVATTTLTLDLNLIGTATLDAAWNFNDNALEFYAAQSDVSSTKGEQILSPIALGGVGTSTERDDYIPDVTNAPVGLVWVNTTDNLIQMVKGSAGSRAWTSIAPLTSVWSDGGGDLNLTSTGQSLVTLNSGAGGNSSVVLQESGAQKGRIIYGSGAGEMIFEGGLTTGTAGRIYFKVADGKPYYRQWLGGVGQTEFSMMPEEIYANPINSLRYRTGAGSPTTVTFTNHTLVHSGTIPSELQTLFEDSAYDEIVLDISAVLETEFSGSPASSVNMGVAIWFGSGYDTTPPADLNSGWSAKFIYHQNGDDPYIADYSQSDPYNNSLLAGDIRPAFRVPIYSSTLSGTIDSFAIAVRREDGTSSLDFTWLENDGDVYSSFSVARAFRTVS